MIIRCRPLARPAGEGAKFQNEIFCRWRELGGEPNLEIVDKIYTREEFFSKKGHFDKIFGILPSNQPIHQLAGVHNIHESEAVIFVQLTLLSLHS